MIHVSLPISASSRDFMITSVLYIVRFQGDQNDLHPVEYAYKMKDQLVSVPGGAVLYVMRGAAGYLSVDTASASIANQVVHKWLQRCAHVPAHSCPPKEPTKQRMMRALKLLGEFANDPSFEKRNPWSSTLR